MEKSPSALVFYHYLHPDDVVSAVLFGELCRGLAERGWQVTARPCNRSCRADALSFSTKEDWKGVRIERVRRPRFRQSSTVGRILNILWMQAAWSLDAIRRRSTPDVLIIGTDPILSVLVAIVWKVLRPQTKIVHWCFDLFPEAAFSEGILDRGSFGARFLQGITRRAYQCCDLIVDIGSCMRAQLKKYGSKARHVTLVPWALEEPPEPLPVSQDERSHVFGDANLALMYSGSYGRAHSCSGLLMLARSLRQADAALAFSVRGNRVESLKNTLTAEDSNVRFVPFAPPDKLQERLASADIHVVSLREEWTGTVVPSKFFGALAIGRPVLFFGSRRSSIAELIETHAVGWIWDEENSGDVADGLRNLSTNLTVMAELSRHCHAVYRQHFSRDATLDQWDQQLRQTLGEDRLEIIRS